MHFSGVITVLLTINMLCHVEVTLIQLLNLLEKYYVYLHLCLLSLSSVIKSYKLLIGCCIYKVMFIRLLELLKIQCLFILPILKSCVCLVIKIVRCLFTLL